VNGYQKLIYSATKIEHGNSAKLTQLGLRVVTFTHWHIDRLERNKKRSMMKKRALLLGGRVTLL